MKMRHLFLFALAVGIYLRQKETIAQPIAPDSDDAVVAGVRG